MFRKLFIKVYDKPEFLYDLHFVIRANGFWRNEIVDYINKNLVGDDGEYFVYENELHITIHTNKIDRAVRECKKIANALYAKYDFAVNRGDGWRLSKSHHDTLPCCSLDTNGKRELYVTYGNCEYSNGFNTHTITIKSANTFTDKKRIAL